MKTIRSIIANIAKRLPFVIFMGLFIIFIIILKLIHIQILETNNYKLLSDKNRIRTIPILPERGEIIDEFGKQIISNKRIYKLIIDKEYSKNVQQIILKIKKILPNRTLNKINFNNFQQAVLLDNISWEEISKLSFYIYEMPGVSIESYMERHSEYPYQFSHIIGILAEDPDIKILGYKKGTSGIEEYSNDQLKGKLGRKDVEVNSIGKIIKTVNTVPPQNGDIVQLTINLELQNYIYNLFKEKYKAGSCVVIDVNTGEIKGMVSFPGYNFLKISNEYWNKLLQDPLKPLNNRSIAGLYPPGSVFKIVPAIASLESEQYKDFKTFCNWIFDFNKHEFHCWKKTGHGEVNLSKAISESCDIFFYKLSLSLGINKIFDYATRLGLNNLTNIEISGEVKGLIPNQKWKKETYHKPWYPYETILATIGQGSVLVTPIQLVKMISIIANGGYEITPKLIKTNVEPTDKEKVRISSSSISVIKESLKNVCNSWTGTAFYNISKLGLKICVAGKTGTSQVVKITKKQREENMYKNEHKPWWNRDHALFIGFAPYESPKYAVCVILEHECSGSREAAPFAAKVLNKALEIDKTQD